MSNPMDSLRLQGAFKSKQLTLALVVLTLKNNDKEKVTLNDFMQSLMKLAAHSLEFDKSIDAEKEAEFVSASKQATDKFTEITNIIQDDRFAKRVQDYGQGENQVEIKPFSASLVKRQITDAFWDVAYKKMTLFQMMEQLVLANQRVGRDQKGGFEKMKESILGLFMSLYFLYPHFLEAKTSRDLYMIFAEDCQKVSLHHMKTRLFAEYPTSAFEYFHQDCQYRYESMKNKGASCSQNETYMRTEYFYNVDEEADSPKILLPSTMKSNRKVCREYAPYELMIFSHRPDVSVHIESVLKDFRDVLRNVENNRPKLDMASNDKFQALMEGQDQAIKELYERIRDDRQIKLDISVFIYLEFRDFIIKGSQGDDYAKHLQKQFAQDYSENDQIKKVIDGIADEKMKRFYYMCLQFCRLRFYNKADKSNKGYLAHWVGLNEAPSKFESMLSQYSMMKNGDFSQLQKDSADSVNQMAAFQQVKHMNDMHDAIVTYTGDDKPKFHEKCYCDFVKMLSA